MNMRQRYEVPIQENLWTCVYVVCLALILGISWTGVAMLKIIRKMMKASMNIKLDKKQSVTTHKQVKYKITCKLCGNKMSSDEWTAQEYLCTNSECLMGRRRRHRQKQQKQEKVTQVETKKEMYQTTEGGKKIIYKRSGTELTCDLNRPYRERRIPKSISLTIFP